MKNVFSNHFRFWLLHALILLLAVVSYLVLCVVGDTNTPWQHIGWVLVTSVATHTHTQNVLFFFGRDYDVIGRETWCSSISFLNNGHRVVWKLESQDILFDCLIIIRGEHAKYTTLSFVTFSRVRESYILTRNNNSNNNDENDVLSWSIWQTNRAHNVEHQREGKVFAVVVADCYRAILSVLRIIRPQVERALPFRMSGIETFAFSGIINYYNAKYSWETIEIQRWQCHIAILQVEIIGLRTIASGIWWQSGRKERWKENEIEEGTYTEYTMCRERERAKERNSTLIFVKRKSMQYSRFT